MKVLFTSALFLMSVTTFAQVNDLEFCREQYKTINESVKYIHDHVEDGDEKEARLSIQKMALRSTNNICNELLGKRKNNKVKNEVVIDWNKIAQEAAEATDRKFGIEINPRK